MYTYVCMCIYTYIHIYTACIILLKNIEDKNLKNIRYKLTHDDINVVSKRNTNVEPENIQT